MTRAAMRADDHLPIAVMREVEDAAAGFAALEEIEQADAMFGSINRFHVS